MNYDLHDDDVNAKTRQDPFYFNNIFVFFSMLCLSDVWNDESWYVWGLLFYHLIEFYFVFRCNSFFFDTHRGSPWKIYIN